MAASDGPLNGANLEFVESLLAAYAADPTSVDPEWRAYFDHQAGASSDVRLGPSFKASSIFHGAGAASGSSRSSSTEPDVAALQDKVDQLIRAYRVRGHLIANLDPLGLPRPASAELELEHYGLTQADLERTVSARTIAGEGARMSVREIIAHLRARYCGSLATQFMHIDDQEIKLWLQTEVE